MTIADIIQIILSVFSLIATVAVSVIIYKFERKNERLREKMFLYNRDVDSMHYWNI